MSWRRASWFLMPALVLGLAEACVRRTADRLPLWYGAADALAASGRVDALFVGSSRVEAAVVPEAFEAAVLARTGQALRTLNMGRGRSTDFEHYLGLRNLLARHPQSLSGLRVFWEAPGGVPVAGRFGVDPWAASEQPWLLVDLLELSDVETLWRSSALDLGTRLHLSLRLWLRPFRLFNRRERLRQSLLSLPSLLAMGRVGEAFGTAPLGADLRARGHLYDNAAGVLAAREGATEFASGPHNVPGAWRGGQQTGVSLAVDLVRAHGGQVIFFRPPEADVFERTYASPAWLEERRAFEERADAWGCPRLSPLFPHADDDLPDLWHLRPARAPEFTRALADAWVQSAAPEAARP